MIIKKIVLMAVFSLSLLFLIACDTSVRKNIESNLIVFENDEIAKELITKMKDQRVVLVGEYHGVSEHKDFVTDFMLELNTYNDFDLMLLEMPHGFNWIVEDYISGDIDQLPVYLENFIRVDIERIKAYNLKNSEENQIKVGAIDINHNPNIMAISLRTMMDWYDLENMDMIEDFLKVLSDDKEILEDSDKYYDHVDNFSEHLKANNDLLIDYWGELHYKRILEMVEIEKNSIVCRKPLEEGDVKLRSQLRENLIKELVDGYLKNNENGTLINIGFYHGQKTHLLGTENQWLGQYLKDESPYTDQKSYVLTVVPATGEIRWGDSDIKKIDVKSGDKNNELFKVMASIAGDRRAFLSLDDDFFSEKMLYINYHYETVQIIPKQVFDGFILLPYATIEE